MNKMSKKIDNTETSIYKIIACVIVSVLLVSTVLLGIVNMFSTVTIDAVYDNPVGDYKAYELKDGSAITYHSFETDYISVNDGTNTIAISDGTLVTDEGIARFMTDEGKIVLQDGNSTHTVTTEAIAKISVNNIMGSYLLLNTGALYVCRTATDSPATPSDYPIGLGSTYITDTLVRIGDYSVKDFFITGSMCMFLTTDGNLYTFGNYTSSYKYLSQNNIEATPILYATNVYDFEVIQTNGIVVYRTNDLSLYMSGKESAFTGTDDDVVNFKLADNVLKYRLVAGSMTVFKSIRVFNTSGEFWCKGNSFTGIFSLPNHGFDDVYDWTKVTLPTTFKDMYFWDYNTIGISSTGEVWGCGNNGVRDANDAWTYNRMGIVSDGDTVYEFTKATLIPDGIEKIYSGSSNTLSNAILVRNNGVVYYITDHAVYIPHLTTFSVPTSAYVASISRGNNGAISIYVLTDDGRLYGYGYNDKGQFNQGNTDSVSSPVLIDSGVSEYIGDTLSCYYIKSGDLYGCGMNTSGFQSADVSQSVLISEDVRSMGDDGGLWYCGYDGYKYFCGIASVTYPLGAERVNGVCDISLPPNEDAPNVAECTFSNGVLTMVIYGVTYTFHTERAYIVNDSVGDARVYYGNIQSDYYARPNDIVTYSLDGNGTVFKGTTATTGSGVAVATEGISVGKGTVIYESGTVPIETELSNVYTILADEYDGTKDIDNPATWYFILKSIPAFLSIGLLAYLGVKIFRKINCAE